MTGAARPPGSPPGWYPDPGGQPFQRWWNGTTWTDATHPPPQAPTAAPSGPDALHNRDASPTLPGPPSPPSSRLEGGRWRGRVRQLAWASVPVWSLGALAFAPFLRLAFARRKAKDWGVFAAYLAAVVVEIVLVSVTGSEDAGSAAAGGVAIALMGLAAVHAFIAFRPATDVLADAVRLSPSQPSQQALAMAQARMQRRKEARELAQANPVLARELRIGRPDLPRQYDDGGLVDVNHVPAEILTSVLELTPQEATAVATARTQLGRFTSPEELSAYAQLAPDRVDALRDLLWFG
jgi:DNA uptake protein ComE-like DNA-binding protein